jgi:hypothetical protein
MSCIVCDIKREMKGYPKIIIDTTLEEYRERVKRGNIKGKICAKCNKKV